MLATRLRLPHADGTLTAWVPSDVPRHAVTPQGPPRTRVAYAAAHVVCDPRSPIDPVLGGAVDWDATLAYRRHLWSLGLAVAEAMDTAQRGMGLGVDDARELIRRSAAEARSCGGTIACGAMTDALDAGPTHRLDAIEQAFLEQCAFIEDQGCAAIVMCSRALAHTARGADDYARVYRTVLGALQRPAILHWLGPMFDPQLAGYWGIGDLDRATETFVEIVRASAASLLKPNLPPETARAVQRRIIGAQALYAVGALPCVIDTTWNIGFIVLVQLNYVTAPRIGFLSRM